MKRALTALPLLLTLAALGWWLWPARLEGPAPMTAPPAGAAVSAPPPAEIDEPPVAAAAAAAVRPAQPQPPALPPHLAGDKPLPEVLDQLLQRAESGDVLAMQELGRRLGLCSEGHLDFQRGQLKIKREDLTDRHAAESPTFRENLQREVDSEQRLISECEAVPEALRRSAAEWMERAAATGSGQAQLAYVDNALSEFGLLDEDRIVGQIEEFLRRRDLARRFLAEAMTHCVPGALGSQYSHGELLFERKDLREYMINRAASAAAVVREFRAEGAEERAVQRMQTEFDELAQTLDAAARAEAQRRGEAMFNTCAPR